MTEGRKVLLVVFLFGSIWGGLEALVSAASHDINFVMPRSVILAFVSLLVLTMARFLLPKTGSTAAIGLVASGFKLLSLPDISACQIAAVIGQAAILDIVFSAGVLNVLQQRITTFVGAIAISSYLNSIIFAFSQAYVFRNEFWLERGVSGLFTWSFGIGSLAALSSVIGALLAFAIVHRRTESWEYSLHRHSTASVRAAVAISLGCWIVGLLVAPH